MKLKNNMIWISKEIWNRKGLSIKDKLQLAIIETELKVKTK